VDVAGQPLAGVEVAGGDKAFEPNERGEYVWVYQSTAVSAADGRFELTLESVPEGDELEIVFRLPGLLPAELHLPTRLSGGIELGSIPLRRGVPVQVALHDTQGRPLHEGWTFEVPSLMTPVKRIAGGELKHGVSSSGFSADLGPDGLRIEAMRPGTKRLRLEHFSGAGVEVEFEVPEWSPEVSAVEVQAVYDGPDLSGLIAIRFALNDFFDLPPGSPLSPQGIEVFGPDGPLPLTIGFDPATARPLSQARDVPAPSGVPGLSFRIGPQESIFVRSGGKQPMTLSVLDPRYIPLMRSLEPSGEVTEIRIEGNSSLILELVDRASGEAIQEAQIALEVDGSFETFDFLDASDLSAEDGGTVTRRVLRGLPPDALRLRIQADGHGHQKLELPAVEPGGTRRLRVELDGSVWARIVGQIEGQAPLQLFRALVLQNSPAYVVPNYQIFEPETIEPGLFELDDLFY
jgi:hypothetical protein